MPTPAFDAGPQADVLWVGLDAGATKLALCTVEGDLRQGLVVGARRGRQDWPQVSGFAPPSLAQQHAQRARLEAGDDPRDTLEREQAEAWLHTLANAVTELLQGLPARPVGLGLCLPGLKDAAGRALHVVAHGPRLPRLAEELERQLAARNVPLARPLGPLLSDGEAAVHGERWAREGHLREARTGLVLGLGTGLAEGWLEEGRVLAAQDVSRRFPAAHGTPLADLAPELLRPADPVGLSVEEAVAPGGVQRALAREQGEPRPLPAAEAARRGDPLARELLTRAARALGALVAERASRIGGEPVVVLGQRAVGLAAEPELASCWSEPLAEALRARGVCAPPLLSRLVLSPALGAVAQRLAAADEATRS